MDAKDVTRRAEELFAGGLHCAEAVLLAVLEGEGAAGAGVSPRVASAFGGGVGRCKEDLCGVLSGGFIALGVLHGRDAAGEKWDQAASLARSVRERFVQEHGCTQCGRLLEKFGPQEDMDQCIRLAGETAGMFHEALRSAQEPAAASCGCTARQPRPGAGASSCGCGCG